MALRRLRTGKDRARQKALIGSSNRQPERPLLGVSGPSAFGSAISPMERPFLVESRAAACGRGLLKADFEQYAAAIDREQLMNETISIPVILVPRLILLTGTELTRQRRVYEEIGEEEWPAHFDAHDIIKYEDVLEQLEEARATNEETVELPLWTGTQLLLELAQKHGVAIVVKG